MQHLMPSIEAHQILLSKLVGIEFKMEFIR